MSPERRASPITADARRTGGSEHQRDSIEKKCGRKRTEQEVLDRRFTADGGAPSKSSQNVSGDRRNFQRDKDQNKFHRRRHQAHADRAEQD